MSQTTNIMHMLAKSSAFVFIGTVISLFLIFIGRIVLVRLTSQHEYGLYTLALTIVTIFAMLSSLGLQDGLTRHIAYLKCKQNTEIISDIIVSATVISLVVSFLSIVTIFITADYIAQNVFNSPDMSQVLRSVSITIPFVVAINILVAVFRAFNIPTIRVYFQDIFKPLSYIFFLGIVALLHLSFMEMVYSYVLSIAFTCFFMIWYFLKKGPIMIKWNKIIVNNNTKEMFVYSMPLLAAEILFTFMLWTDTLMLGYFRTTEEVASYNAAYPIAQLLSVVITSIGFLYVPIVSKLYRDNQITEIRVINASSTKWCFMLTFPLFVLMFLFPDILLNLFYGFRYIDASNVLQILACGFIMNSYFGLNYYTLMSTGKSSFIMLCSLISAILNIALNLLLIPLYGILGAAIASAFSFITIEVYMTRKLHKFLNVHPFTFNYLKFTLVAVFLIVGFYNLGKLFIPTYAFAAAFYMVFLCVYIISIYCSKVLDEQETSILKEIKKKINSHFWSQK